MLLARQILAIVAISISQSTYCFDGVEFRMPANAVWGMVARTVVVNGSQQFEEGTIVLILETDATKVRVRPSNWGGDGHWVPSNVVLPTAKFRTIRSLPKSCKVQDGDGDCDVDYLLQRNGTFTRVSCVGHNPKRAHGTLFSHGVFPYYVGRFSNGFEVSIHRCQP